MKKKGPYRQANFTRFRELPEEQERIHIGYTGTGLSVILKEAGIASPKTRRGAGGLCGNGGRIMPLNRAPGRREGGIKRKNAAPDARFPLWGLTPQAGGPPAAARSARRRMVTGLTPQAGELPPPPPRHKTASSVRVWIVPQAQPTTANRYAVCA
jgi:hypothetical protein